MHSRMTWWTDESILWYERASKASDYHRRLTDEIERHIRENESVLELGCGLGYEAELLSDDGYDIRAVDIEPVVIEKAIERTGKDIFRCCDASELRERSVVALCINYGHIEDASDLKEIVEHATRKVIYVISRHSGHNQDTRPDRTDLICSILEREGYSYTRSDLELDFSQPLRSEEEARSFIRWTYLGKNQNQYLGFLEKTYDKDYPYVFRNRKNLVLFDIETGERI